MRFDHGRYQTATRRLVERRASPPPPHPPFPRMPLFPMPLRARTNAQPTPHPTPHPTYARVPHPPSFASNCWKATMASSADMLFSISSCRTSRCSLMSWRSCTPPRCKRVRCSGEKEAALLRGVGRGQCNRSAGGGGLARRKAARAGLDDRYLSHARTVAGTCLDEIWAVPSSCEGHAWAMPGF